MSFIGWYSGNFIPKFLQSSSKASSRVHAGLERLHLPAFNIKSVSVVMRHHHHPQTIRKTNKFSGSKFKADYFTFSCSLSSWFLFSTIIIIIITTSIIIISLKWLEMFQEIWKVNSCCSNLLPEVSNDRKKLASKR